MENQINNLLPLFAAVLSTSIIALIGFDDINVRTKRVNWKRRD